MHYNYFCFVFVRCFIQSEAGDVENEKCNWDEPEPISNKNQIWIAEQPNAIHYIKQVHFSQVNEKKFCSYGSSVSRHIYSFILVYFNL